MTSALAGAPPQHSLLWGLFVVGNCKPNLLLWSFERRQARGCSLPGDYGFLESWDPVKGRKYLFRPRLCVEASQRWGFHSYPQRVIVNQHFNEHFQPFCMHICGMYSYKISLSVYILKTIGCLATAYLSPLRPCHMKHCICEPTVDLSNICVH